MTWKRYKVRATRLVEEECEFYLVNENEEAAREVALKEVESVVDTIWLRSDTEPHTYTLESVSPIEERCK